MQFLSIKNGERFINVKRGLMFLSSVNLLNGLSESAMNTAAVSTSCAIHQLDCRLGLDTRLKSDIRSGVNGNLHLIKKKLPSRSCCIIVSFLIKRKFLTRLTFNLNKNKLSSAVALHRQVVADLLLLF